MSWLRRHSIFSLPERSVPTRCPRPDRRPMKLCPLCSSIGPQMLKEPSQHHASFKALDSSATTGCQMCTLLRDAHLQYYMDHPALKMSAEAARDLNLRALDSAGDFPFFLCEEEVQSRTLPETVPLPGCVKRRAVQGYRFYRKGALHPSAPKDMVEEFESQELMRYVRLKIRAFQDKKIPEDYALLGAAFIAVRAHRGSNAPHFAEVFPYDISPCPDFLLARTWISACLHSHHGICRSSSAPPLLPTRVVYVGTANGPAVPRILVTRGAARGFYVALSHCWGGASSVMLTEANIDALSTTGISFESLPLTFQDAVTATRRLGYHYLWIDALCIMQSCEEDWARECARMAATFRDATVTITGPAAANTETGFLQPRAQVATESQVWEFTCDGDGGRQQKRRVNVRGTAFDEAPVAVRDVLSPVGKRAWVLQEQVLSARTLYFGKSAMYLECARESRYEHLPDFGVADEPLYGTKQYLSRLSNIALWHELVEKFSQRDISEPSDRLPALSGLASQRWEGSQDSYLAGLSREHLHLSLAWFADFDDVSRPPDKCVEDKYAGPSWSWVACRYPILHAGPSPSYSADLKVLTIEVHPSTEDPYGRVASGVIEAHSRLKLGMVRRIHEEGHGHWFELHDSFAPVAFFYPDDPLAWQAREPGQDPRRAPRRKPKGITDSFMAQVTCLCLCDGAAWLALVVEAVAGAAGNTFRRIGFAESMEAQTEQIALLRGNSDKFHRGSGRRMTRLNMRMRRVWGADTTLGKGFFNDATWQDVVIV